MKKWVLFIIVIAGINLQKTFGQTFPWADSAISYMEASNGPYGYAICTDDSDNIFVTGYQDIDNIFSLKKYNTSGLLKWNKTGLVNYGVATDNWGNCYTTGYYFFQKFSSNGALIHKDSATGLAHNSIAFTGSAICYDGHKYLYIAGDFSATSGSTIILGKDSILFGTNPMGFILKCDTGGNIIWAKASVLKNGLVSGFLLLGINHASNGQIYVTGHVTDTVLLGSYSLNSKPGQKNSFVACYDSNGNVIWANTNNRYNSVGNSISSDGAGNVYITGSANFNCFIAKYKNNGDSIWWNECKTLPNRYSWGYGISTNSSGISFITGGYQGTPFGSLTFPYGGSEVDIFMVKYDSSGNAVWGYDPNDTLPGSESNIGYCVTTDKEGCNFYFTGVTMTPARFNNTFIYEGFYVTELENGCTLGVDNLANTKESLKVYPNPFTSSTTILFIETGKHQVEVEDMTGRILQQFECSGQQYELQRGSLARGMYFIKVTDEQKNISVSKILVQ